MGEVRLGWHPAEEDPGEEGATPGLTDPLQVPDVFATNVDIEVLRDHVRIVLSALRRNEFGEAIRPVVSRTVLTTDGLFECLEGVLAALLASGDPRVQKKLFAVLDRLMTALATPPGGKTN